MATTNDLKNGMVLNLDGELWAVVEFQHVKPGKGGAFVRTTLKNVLSGKVVDKTFNAGTKVETATVDKRTMQYLYADGDDYVFMDLDTFEQIHVPGATVGDAANYLLPEAEATVATHEGVPLYIELPTSVVLEITYTEPGLQGDRSTGGNKPATVETGATVRCRCSSPPARRSRSTPATAATSAGPDGRGCPRQQISPARRKARRRALDVLYSADLRDRPPVDGARRTCSTGSRSPGRAHVDYAVDLVEGVAANADRIDELIASYAEGWTLDRMPVVDRNLARIAVYELLYATRSTTRWRSPRRSSWPGSCPPTTRRASSTACSAASPSTPPADPPPLTRATAAPRSSTQAAPVVGRCATAGTCSSARNGRRADRAITAAHSATSRPSARVVRSGVEERARVVDQHAVLVEPLDQAGGGVVVDDRQRPQVVGADREHPAVVVAALLLDGAGVLGDVGEVVGGRGRRASPGRARSCWRARAAPPLPSGSSSATGTR